MGLFTCAFNVGITSSALLFGWVAEAVGYRWMYTFAGVLVMASLLGFVGFDPVRQRTHTPAAD